tara:strand:- start:303 stop:734 length:432 start_codon:yes stop_codon:yes gene_type:complete
MSGKKKQEFVSNVTGEEWHKHNSQSWKRCINQVGIIKEDETHKGKNGTTLVLKKGSEVLIDDIRGRIKPQYRVKDKTGKIWFVSALNVDVVKTENTYEEQFQYRGGVRHDGTNASPYRYVVEKTTEDELNEIKTRAKEENNNG